MLPISLVIQFYSKTFKQPCIYKCLRTTKFESTHSPRANSKVPAWHWQKEKREGGNTNYHNYSTNSYPTQSGWFWFICHHFCFSPVLGRYPWSWVKIGVGLSAQGGSGVSASIFDPTAPFLYLAPVKFLRICRSDSAISGFYVC